MTDTLPESVPEPQTSSPESASPVPERSEAESPNSDSSLSEETPAAAKGESSGLRKRKDILPEEDVKKDASPVEARYVGAKRPGEQVKGAASQAVEFCKHPEALVPIIRSHLDTHVPHDIMLVFLFIWAPLLIIAVGSVTGQLIVLTLRHIHFLIGLAAAVYVLQLYNLRTSGAHEGLHSRFLQIFFTASVLPIFMIQESNFLFRILTLIAFTGSPFLLRRYFRSNKKSDDVKPQQATNELFLSIAAAPAVIFTISIGGTSFWNALSIAPFFGLAAFLAYRSVDLLVQRLEPFVPEPHRPLLHANKLTVFAVQELLIANILLAIASWILIPQSILDEQSGTLTVIFITLIGIILLALSNILASAETLDSVSKQFSLPANVVDLALKGFTGAVVASFVLLLIEHVFKLLEL